MILTGAKISKVLAQLDLEAMTCAKTSEVCAGAPVSGIIVLS